MSIPTSVNFTLALGATAPDFKLQATDGQFYNLDSFASSSLLVIFFTCNHCPYVMGSNDYTSELALRFEPQGISFVAINSNSVNTYSEDSFEGMCSRMNAHKFPWVYLHDKDQSVALSYGALRTPHFYLFDKERKLRYCGRSTDQPKNPSLAKTHDLQKAIEEVLDDKPVSTPLTNPIGCNVKWEGKDPYWMPAEACDLV